MRIIAVAILLLSIVSGWSCESVASDFTSFQSTPGVAVPLIHRASPRTVGLQEDRELEANYQYQDTAWALAITLGNSSLLYVNFDTGSSDLIVSGSLCTDPIGCTTGLPYVPSDSAMVEKCDALFRCPQTGFVFCNKNHSCVGMICYNDATGAKSILTHDYFGIPQLPVKVYTTFGNLFAPIATNCGSPYETLGVGFLNGNFSGLLGSSYPGYANFGVDPLPFDALLAANNLPAIFSLCTVYVNPFMSVGADYFYNPEFTYLPILLSTNQYDVIISDFGIVGGVGALSSGLNSSEINGDGTLVDSGTYQLVINSFLSDMLWAALMARCEEGIMMFGVCSETVATSIFNASFMLTESQIAAYPSLYVTLVPGGQPIEMTPQDYLVPSLTNGSLYQAMIELYSDNILGNIFMQKVHVVFDKMREMVGFGPPSTCTLSAALPPPCEVPSPLPITTVSGATQCLNTFAYNSTLAPQVISTLQTQLQLYPFLQANTAGLSPFGLTYNLSQVLQGLAGTTYQSDYAFHVAVAAAIRGCRDGNTYYSIPEGYSNSFTTIQPLGITSIEPTNGAQIIVVKTTPMFMQLHNMAMMTSAPSMGFPPQFANNLTIYDGWQVVAIDGVEAMSYLQSWTNQQFPISKDPAINFNAHVMSSFSAWNIWYPGILPVQNSISFTLQSPPQVGSPVEVNITVPYIVLQRNNATVIASLNQGTSPPPPNRFFTRESDSEKTPLLQWRHEKQRIEETIKQLLHENGRIVEEHLPSSIDKRDSYLLQAIAVSEINPIYWQISSWRGTTLVLSIESFNWTTAVAQEVIPVLSHLYQSTLYGNLIIDLRSTGGGNEICGGVLLANYLVNGYSTSTKLAFAQWDLVSKNSLITQTMSTSLLGSLAAWNFSGWTTQPNLPNTILSSLYSQGTTSSIQSVTTSYSTPIAFCPPVTAPTPSSFPTNQIFILTDGVTFSSAAAFIKLLIGSGVRTTTLGGIPGTPIGMSTVFVGLPKLTN